MKMTLSTPRKNLATSQCDPAPDPAFESIAELVASLRSLQQQTAAAYSPKVHHIIQSRSRDVQEIEQALDRLLDCACIPEGLHLFKAFCRYYYNINPAATASYVHAYREMWDSEADQEQEVAP